MTLSATGTLKSQVAAFRSFADFVGAVRRTATHDHDPRLNGLNICWQEVRAAAGMNETDGSAGGFLVPDQFNSELWFKSFAASLAGRCAVMTTNSPVFELPAIDETSRVDGSRSGLQSLWTDETLTAVTASKPKFAKLTFVMKKLATIVHVTNELIADSDIAQILERLFIAESSTMMDAAIIGGTGAGRPLGILNSSATITIAKETSQAAGTILAANLERMYGALWGPSRSRAVWLVSEQMDTLLQQTFTPGKNVAGTENSGALPLYVYATADDEPNRLMGRPVLVSDHCAQVGTLGDIILGDLSQYGIVNRDLRISVSDAYGTNWQTDQSTFRMVARLDGQPLWKTPLSPKNGAAQVLSPFVTLAAR